jgi:hypothetical protein
VSKLFGIAALIRAIKVSKALSGLIRRTGGSIATDAQRVFEEAIRSALGCRALGEHSNRMTDVAPACEVPMLEARIAARRVRCAPIEAR